MPNYTWGQPAILHLPSTFSFDEVKGHSPRRARHSLTSADLFV
jgi:hypothetical protein